MSTIVLAAAPFVPDDQEYLFEARQMQALSFGLVPRDRFDREAAEADVEKPAVAVAPHRRPLARLTVLALAIGLPLTLIPIDGSVQAVGVVALVAFVAFGSVALGSTAAATAARDEER